MTPEQKDRIRLAAEGLQAALNAAEHTEIRIEQRITELRHMGESRPRFLNEIRIEAHTCVEIFP